MFDAVRNNKRIVQFFLALITLPFALWGVDSYVRNASDANEAATVGGGKISAREFQQALIEQQDSLRARFGRNFNPASFDTPETRLAVLDTLINQRLLMMQVAKSNITISDDQLREVIGAIPALQEGGKFSAQRYETALRSQGMTQAGFEAKLRQDLQMQQMIGALSGATIVPRKVTERWLLAQQEEREISEAIFPPERFIAQTKIEETAVKAFYDNNRKLFELPEQARAEYIILNPDALLEQAAPIAENEIKVWYDGHLDRYKQDEERRASHILIQFTKDAPEAEQKAARGRAEDILKQAKQNPASFAKLAAQHSQDTGSAQNGGDLGFFGRGAMVKPFEEVAFALKENQMSELVRSDFGFHIIKLTGIKPSKTRPFDEVRGEIAQDLKLQAASRKYTELAESFANTVYEQADSLKPAAEKLKLQVQQSPWMAKGGRAAPPFNNDKLLGALFGDDAIKNKRNTEAVEVGQNTMVAARVIEHKPATLRPLEEVQAQIRKQLAQDEALKLAQRDGEDKLARLVKDEKLDMVWSAPHSVTRGGAPGLTPEALRGVFKAPAGKLPAYAGASVPNGVYAIYRISAVKRGAVREEDAKVKNLRLQYQRLRTEEEFGTYIEALRAAADITVNKKALVKEK